LVIRMRGEGEKLLMGAEYKRSGRAQPCWASQPT